MLQSGIGKKCDKNPVAWWSLLEPPNFLPKISIIDEGKRGGFARK